MKIISVNEFKSFKDVGKNKVDEDKINQIIDEAQITELKEVLGNDFYFDVLSNLDNPDYQVLLSGGSFTSNGINYHQEGLKSLLADYVMAKFVIQSNINFTPFGSVTKVHQDSQPVERNSLKDMSTQQFQYASAKWEIIEMYLNSESFTNWKNNNCTSSSNRRYKFRTF